MLPNALSSTGPYADLWSHIRSMQFALKRAALLYAVEGKISAFAQHDKERLLALAKFLQVNLPQASPEAEQPIYSVEFESKDDMNFAPEMNLKNLRDIQELSSWHSGAKMGLQRKIQKLIEFLEDFAHKTPQQLISDGKVPEEIKILDVILGKILRETETAFSR